MVGPPSCGSPRGVPGYAVVKEQRCCWSPDRRRGAVSRTAGTGWRAAKVTNASRRQSVVRTRAVTPHARRTRPRSVPVHPSRRLLISAALIRADVKPGDLSWRHGPMLRFWSDQPFFDQLHGAPAHRARARCNACVHGVSHAIWPWPVAACAARVRLIGPLPCRPEWSDTPGS